MENVFIIKQLNLASGSNNVLLKEHINDILDSHKNLISLN